ncbi:hypothetical protein [uncultured Brevundimonas sp.]|uniref:hypothetical protein n=1 Tax=uncultured Brevundimonas sp. TaxID=213418 RepID=UPI0025CBA2DE|nr:hypothetical protein [uncultured Brevundimonas sp.]
MIGRAEFYAEDEIASVPCQRCGSPSSQQWQVCALDNRWLGICTDCDIDLNATTLKFMRVPEADALIAAYAEARK